LLAFLLPIPHRSFRLRRRIGTTQPITTVRGEGRLDLLPQWVQGRAGAGKVGEWYDTADRGQLGLDLSPIRKIQGKIAYTDEDRKALSRRAPQQLERLLSGKSSSAKLFDIRRASPPAAAKCAFYTCIHRYDVLYAEYRGGRQNVYMYPEHCGPQKNRPAQREPNNGELSNQHAVL